MIASAVKLEPSKPVKAKQKVTHHRKSKRLKKSVKKSLGQQTLPDKMTAYNGIEKVSVSLPVILAPSCGSTNVVPIEKAKSKPSAANRSSVEEQDDSLALESWLFSFANIGQDPSLVRKTTNSNGKKVTLNRVLCCYLESGESWGSCPKTVEKYGVVQSISQKQREKSKKGLTLVHNQPRAWNHYMSEEQKVRSDLRFPRPRSTERVVPNGEAIFAKLEERVHKYDTPPWDIEEKSPPPAPTPADSHPLESLSEYGSPATPEEVLEWTQPVSSGLRKKLASNDSAVEEGISEKIVWPPKGYIPSGLYKEIAACALPSQGVVHKSTTISDKLPKTSSVSRVDARKTGKRLLRSGQSLVTHSDGKKNIPELGASFDNSRFNAWLQAPDWMRRKTWTDPYNVVQGRRSPSLNSWWSMVALTSGDEVRLQAWLLERDVYNYRNRRFSSLHPRNEYEAQAFMLQRALDVGKFKQPHIIKSVERKIKRLLELSEKKVAGAAREVKSLVVISEPSEDLLSKDDKWRAVREANFVSAVQYKRDNPPPHLTEDSVVEELRAIQRDISKEAFIIETLDRNVGKVKEVSKAKPSVPRKFVPKNDINNFVDIGFDASGHGDILVPDLDSPAFELIYQEVLMSKGNYISGSLYQA